MDDSGGREAAVSPILSAAGAAGSRALTFRWNESVLTPNSPPDCCIAAIPSLCSEPCRSAGSYEDISLNIKFKSPRLIFVRSVGRGGGGPLARGVGAEDGLTENDRLEVIELFNDALDDKDSISDCVCFIDALDENDIISEGVFV
jgi:hypothetical protein